MLLSRYFQNIYLQSTAIVGMCFLVLIACVGLMGELKQIDMHYHLIDAIIYTLSVLPTNFSRLYPTVLALSSVMWVTWMRERQELIIAHALGLSRLGVITSLFPALIAIVIACTACMEWIAPALGSHAKQVQTLQRSEGKLAHSEDNHMWLKTKKGFMRVTPLIEEKKLLNIYQYHVEHNEVVAWSYAPEARWYNQHWVAETQTTHTLDNYQQGQKKQGEVTLPLNIQPDIFEKARFKTDYFTLNQIWTSLKKAKAHGVLERVTWVNYWLRVLTPLHAICLVTMVLIWLQVSLDLRSPRFSWWVMTCVAAIILDFTVVEILESIKWRVDIWEGLAIAAFPLGCVIAGAIGGVYVRN